MDNIAISPSLPAVVDERRGFRAAAPFPHLVSDGYLPAPLFAALSSELAGLRLSRRGPGYEWRMIRRSIADLGPACARVEARLRSPETLAWARGIVGEPGLELGPWTCGGLFRDGRGPGLDPHLDMNCTVPGRRRRATLILYVHPRWRPEWGGRLELFGDPGRPAEASVAPEPNRAVLLDSGEGTWHGVSPIVLPPEARATGRLALILNFYARGRAPRRLNVWMPRPGPAALRDGRALSPADRARLRDAYLRRLERLRPLRALELAAAPRARQAALPGLPASHAWRRSPREACRRARAALTALDGELRRLYRREYSYRSSLGGRP